MNEDEKPMTASEIKREWERVDKEMAKASDAFMAPLLERMRRLLREALR